MSAFVGIDLAWTPGRPSGICVLSGEGEDVYLDCIDTVVARPTALARQLAALGHDIIAAIDAPLVISPGRRAEALLARKFGRAKAYAYHTSREWLARNNAFAGPQLAEALSARGFSLQMPPSPQARGRYALEVFPHATHVALFGLDERLKYKRGTLAARRLVMHDYQDELRRLLGSVLPHVAADPRIIQLLDPESIPMAGVALKSLEDRLDALTCAIAAHHAWLYGAAGLEAFGTPEHGQIIVPKRPAPEARD